ncbi:hypothetical protein DCAR_0831767 [Daucus carota subsp. sativus]|uniref:Secreted protein n=1 Tax=Daucus carota subsp. sativus TaxID=79200 RepID=A0AAF0XQQ8_DAUCS|nr:hypothetical protein DCAR_0831767 [Daucus carota subsp. sativus]
MLNIFSLICICLNSAFYSSSLFFAKLPEAYAFLNPIVDLISELVCTPRFIVLKNFIHNPLEHSIPTLHSLYL